LQSLFAFRLGVSTRFSRLTIALAQASMLRREQIKCPSMPDQC